MPGQTFCLLQSYFLFGHIACFFQRVLWRDQPPDLIKAKPFHGFQTNVKMPGMGRVERTAQQADFETAQQIATLQNV